MKNTIAKILTIYVLFVMSTNAHADILKTPPGNPDPTRSYLFYLHGQIVEGSNGRPVSSEYGPYEYYDIFKAFSSNNFVVISEIRPKNTDSETYSVKVGEWIKSLIKRGVPPSNISVVGASKGGNIAARISSALQMPNINYVILAGLFAGRESERGLKLSGRVLSIHDSSDKFPITPENYFNKSVNIKAKKVIITNTGLGHGMLYRPYDEWLSEALSWINPKTE
jgi:hypothetical protein